MWTTWATIGPASAPPGSTSVNAPLVDAGLTKAEIRELSRMAGLPTWDRPASACLSSRIPYGTPVTIQNVKTVEVGEEELKALGFRQFRVRFHGEVVRIEIAREEMEKALSMEMAGKLTAIFKKLGFKYVTLDLEGYRQGSMNEVPQILTCGPRFSAAPHHSTKVSIVGMSHLPAVGCTYRV